MALPTFLGIGASRSGSTWLDSFLRSHPAIYMPTRRKEIHFFDSFYEQGIKWYEEFFPKVSHAGDYKAIGEFSPGYLSHPEAPRRIKKHLGRVKMLVILRDPVERAYSQWKYRVQKRAECRSFEEFMHVEEEPVELGLYAKQLKRFFSFFEPRNFLILIFERSINEPTSTLLSVGEFLGIDPNKFEKKSAGKALNVSFVPRYRRAYYFAFKVKQSLRKMGLDNLVNSAKAFGIEAVFGRKGFLPPLDPDIRLKYLHLFLPDVQSLRELIRDDIPEWKL